MKRVFLSRWLWVLLLIGAPVIVGAFRWRHNGALIAALIVLAAFWALVLVFLEWAGQKDGNPHRSKYGFIDVIIGADGRVSTSKTVAYGWTGVFASALVVMATLAVSGRLTPDQAFQTGSNWDAYLLLLGGPYASAVIAKGIVSYQTQQDPNAKSGTSATAGTANAMSTTAAAAPSAADIVNGDGNEPSLIDTQYSVFSLIAVLYFVGLFVANLDKYAAGAVNAGNAEWFPQIPSALLGLTSLAALTYVGNKAVQTQGLRVASFSPNPAPAGSPVLAKLVNLAPTATQANITIWVTDAAGSTQSLGVTAVDISGSTVNFVAPAAPDTYTVMIAEPDKFTGPVSLVVQ
jgi:hypothetical protein